LCRGHAQSVIVDWKRTQTETAPVIRLLRAMEEDSLLTGTILICIGISIPSEMESDRERLQQNIQMTGSIEEAVDKLNAVVSIRREKIKLGSQNMFDHDLELGDLRHYGFEKDPP
jgi:hypothetical protein